MISSWYGGRWAKAFARTSVHEADSLPPYKELMSDRYAYYDVVNKAEWH